MRWIGTIFLSLLIWAAILVVYALFVPAFAQTGQQCLFGRSEETLRAWSLKTGQIPLLGFDIRIEGEKILPAWLMANLTDGSVAVLYRAQNGLTCVIVVGADARPTPKLPALELPEEDRRPEDSI